MMTSAAIDAFDADASSLAMTAVRHAAASAMEPPAAAATASRRMARCAA